MMPAEGMKLLADSDAILLGRHRISRRPGIISASVASSFSGSARDLTNTSTIDLSGALFDQRDCPLKNAYSGRPGYRFYPREL